MPDDFEDLAELRALGSGLDQRLLQADRAFARGDYAAAAATHSEVAGASGRRIAYPLRRWCQALTELGRSSEAQPVCRDLLAVHIPNAADFAVATAALVRGSGPLPASTLAQARQFVARAEGMDPDSLWALSARCEVAVRVADASTLEQCWSGLARIAPEHRFTRRFALERTAAARWARPLRIAFAMAMLLALLAAAVHKLRASVRLRRSGATAAGAAVAFAALLYGAPASAEGGTSSTLEEMGFGIVEDPAASASTCSGPPSPEAARGEHEVAMFKEEMKVLDKVMSQIKTAEDLILNKGDWPTAINLYVDVIKISPNFVKGWRRLCEGYAYVGRPIDGAHACRQIFAAKQANAWDHSMLVHHLLTGPDGSKSAVRAEVKQLVAEAITMAPKERWGYDAQCELAQLTNDFSSLKSCSQQLQQLAPDDRRSVSLAFVVALREQRFGEAQALIDRARGKGLDEAVLRDMQRTLDRQGPLWRRMKTQWPLGLGAGLGAALLVLAPSWIGRMRKRQAARA